ncbi:hypothetical protein PhCBS80983_g03955 [Powellomyces hirtus]|uniref:Uncharacterized protein n=1 Tax=Powellomyces hirtus TaxID=109895 RepID=A0A507E0G9_9FUNG|nr:hypothetical protein DFJ77DRAFT_466534 [Powellomyces hirtus]TPX57241.1 hypothetical protein PhCBS80983_g03955 [Powellomyces hirtus]
MPVIAPLSATASVLSASGASAASLPNKVRIVPAFSDESDAIRWAEVEKLLKKDFEAHHIEVLNRHTKEHQPNYAIHALLSLYKVNASETILRERYDLESKMLDPVGPSVAKISESNWKEHLGKGQTMYADFTAFFLAEIQAQGIKPTVAKYAPTLIPGLGGDCFHPLLHLGLGLEFQQPLIVAQGLSYWAYTYAPIIDKLPAIMGEDDVANVLEILQDVREDTRFDPEAIHPQWGAIEFHKRVRKAINSKLGADLAELMSEWNVEPNDESINKALEELTDATVLSSATTFHTFPQQLDFPLTHTLIAASSLHMVLPYITRNEDKVELLRRFMLAFLALYVSQGRPTLHPDRLEAIYAESVDDTQLSLPSTSPIGSPTLPNTPQLAAREWHILAGAPAHVDDDVHVMEVIAALKSWEDKYGEKKGYYMKAAKVVRSVVKTGSSDQWEYRGAGYPPSTSFALEMEE